MKEQVSEQDLANTKAFASAIMEAITPHLLKVAAAAKGDPFSSFLEESSVTSTTEAFQVLDTLDQQRMKFWCESYIAFGVDNADAALIQFDKRFNREVQS